MHSEGTKPRRSFLANSIFGVLAWFLPIVLGFFSTPILVRGLGTEEYGVYAIILGFLSYSFTFGVGRIASKFVAEYKSTGNDEGISQAVSATLFFSIVVGVAGALVLGFLTPWIVSEILVLPENTRRQAEIGLYLASFAGVMVMISQVFQSCLQGLHRFGRYALISNVSALLLSIGNITFALAGYGMVELIAWNLFTVLASGILFFFTAFSALPNFRPTLRIGPVLRNAVLKYGSNIILYQIFGNCFFIFERGWIVRTFGAETVTFYVVPMLIGIYLHGLISSISLVIFPRVNELLNDREHLTRLYERSNRLILSIVVMTVITLAACGTTFLHVWVGPEFEASSYWLLVIHSITFGLIAVIIIPWGVAEAFHAAKINVYITFSWLVVGVGLTFIFGTKLGIEGVALARLAGVLFTLPTILYIEHRFLGRTQTLLWLKAIVKIIPAALCMLLLQWLILQSTEDNWSSLIFAVLLGSILYVIILYFLGIVDRKEIEEFGDALFKRRPRTE